MVGEMVIDDVKINHDALIAGRQFGTKIGKILNDVIEISKGRELIELQTKLDLAVKALQFYRGGENEDYIEWLHRMRNDLGQTAQKTLKELGV